MRFSKLLNRETSDHSRVGDGLQVNARIHSALQLDHYRLAGRIHPQDIQPFSCLLSLIILPSAKLSGHDENVIAQHRWMLNNPLLKIGSFSQALTLETAAF